MGEDMELLLLMFDGLFQAYQLFISTLIGVLVEFLQLIIIFP